MQDFNDRFERTYPLDRKTRSYVSMALVPDIVKYEKAELGARRDQAEAQRRLAKTQLDNMETAAEEDRAESKVDLERKHFELFVERCKAYGVQPAEGSWKQYCTDRDLKF